MYLNLKAWVKEKYPSGISEEEWEDILDEHGTHLYNANLGDIMHRL